MATIAELETMIAEAEEQRHIVALGTATVTITRDGRSITKKVPTLAELEAYIRTLKAELTALQVAAGDTPTYRRRAIGLAWRN